MRTVAIFASIAFLGITVFFGCTANKTESACEEESCEGANNPSSPSGTSSSNTFVSPYQPLTKGAPGVFEGWASRYWDACKPSCSWKDKQQAISGTRCKNCSSNGFTEIAANDETSRSACDGGPAYTCFDQVPHIMSETVAYAFAATPGDGNQCGKCYQIQFDGGFKHSYEGRVYATHTAIKGKTLIVMSSNIGHDVGGGQFDLMIPGGGVGAFNAFTKQLQGLGMSNVNDAALGKQYGGLLSDCEDQLNPYDPNKNITLSDWQTCLRNKCNALFTGSNQTIQTLKDACNFLTDWMMAANNPTLLYKEVECPQYLVDRYKASMF